MKPPFLFTFHSSVYFYFKLIVVLACMFLFLPACSLRLALHGQITLLRLQCVPLSYFVTAELVYAPARTLVVLDVDVWKYHLHVKNIHTD